MLINKVKRVWRKFDKWHEKKKVSYTFWRRISLFLNIIIIVLGLVYFFLYLSFDAYTYQANHPFPISDDIKVTDKIRLLDNFTIQEQNLLRDIFNGLQPEYAVTVNKIYISKYEETLYLYCPEESGGCTDPTTGEIWIYTTSEVVANQNWVKDSLCHEILHSIIRQSENNHRIIYDLASKGVCYKNNLKKGLVTYVNGEPS